MANLRNPEWVRQWEKDPLVVSQVGLMRGIYLESQLVQNMELREDPLVRYQKGGFLVHNMNFS